jgi:UDP-3-O-[3-hydroxymyristoyl] N-acetylglucosamine deacetylase
MRFQKTLKKKTSCVGIGLHSGRKVHLTLTPASTNTGIVFRRVDLGGVEIPARVEHLGRINHATCLADGDTRIETIEHLLAALRALGVDNVIVELDAAEVPIMDGSAAPFIYLIHEAGIREQATSRSFLRITRPLSVEHEGRLVAAYPSNTLKGTYTINFNHPMLRHQEYSLEITDSSFVDDIAPARTFGFQKDVEILRQNGLALGGSLDNALVLSETGVLNNQLRFPDEFVRHKILDILGDLALLNMPLMAHVVAVRAGHGLHTELAQEILSSRDCWESVTLPESEGAPIPAETPALANAPAGD